MIKKQSFPLDPHALPDTDISPQVERQIGRACSCMQPGQVSRSLNRFVLYTQCKKAAYDMQLQHTILGSGPLQCSPGTKYSGLVGRGWFRFCCWSSIGVCDGAPNCGFRGEFAAPGARAGRPRLTSVTRSLNPSAGGRARLRLIRRSMAGSSSDPSSAMGALKIGKPKEEPNQCISVHACARARSLTPWRSAPETGGAS